MNDSLDTDVAWMILTAPLWICGFAVLVVAGWWNDRKVADRG